MCRSEYVYHRLRRFRAGIPTSNGFCMRYGSFGFAKLYTSKRPETAVDVLYDRVLPFYQQHGLPIEAILTDNGTEYKGRPMIHLYEIFLEFNDIEHRTTKVATPRTNGFVERFNRTLLDEFFRSCFRKKLYPGFDSHSYTKTGKR